MVKWISLIALFFGIALAIYYWVIIKSFIFGIVFSVLDIFLIIFLIFEAKTVKGGEDIEYVES